jgi:hypothetical protein
MSIFFYDIDDTGMNVPFGIQSSNVPEVAIFSSTTDDARIGLFTNNYTGVDNIASGSTIGTSNYNPALPNEMYFGHITQTSNVQKIIVIQESNVGINVPIPLASLHVSDSFIVSQNTNPASNSFIVNSAGQVGVNTDPVAGNTMTLKGVLQVDSLKIGGGGMSASGLSLILAAGMETPNGPGASNYLAFGGNSMCNIGSVIANGAIITDTVQALTQPLNTISFVGGNLSNIDTLSANTINVGSKITTSAQNSTISVDNKILTQVAGANVSNLAISTLAALSPSSFINASTTSFQNVGDLHLSSNSVGSTATLYTNSINNTGTQSYIDFNGSDINNANNLTITGNLNVRGELVTTNTSVTTTDQFSIENAGTGPALVVNQIGYDTVAEVQYASNVVLMVKNGGQTLFGNFGQSSQVAANIAGLPPALVYVGNPAASNQTAMYIQQSSSQNILTLQGAHTAPTSNNSVVFTSSGTMGIGSSLMVPNARIQVAQHYTDTTDYMRLTNDSNVASNQSVFVVTNSGRVGVGTDPNVVGLGGNGAELLVNGTIQAYGMVAPNGTNTLTFGNVIMSNISQTVSALGSASSPAYTFASSSSANTGMFAPSPTQVALSTNGVERLRVTSSGTVGINTQSPNSSYALDVSGTAHATSFVGDGNQLTNISGAAITSVISSNYIPTTLLPTTINGSLVAATFTGDGSNITDLNASALTNGIVPIARLQHATTGQFGVTQLIDVVTSNDSTLAATANSVYLANSNANTRVSKYGDTITGPLNVNAHLTAYSFSGDGSNITDLNASTLATGIVPIARLQHATTGQFGVTQLIDVVTSNDSTLAATANSVYLANSNANTRVSKYGDTITGPLNVNAQLTAYSFSGDGSNITDLNASALATGIVPIARLQHATTGQFGVTQLIDVVTSNDSTLAATANSVKIANDNANSRISRSGDTMFGSLLLYGNIDIEKTFPNSADGNLIVGGSMNVYGPATFQSSLIFDGGITVNSIQASDAGNVINMTSSTLSNVNQLEAAAVVAPSFQSPTGVMSMNYNRVLDVDTLIVRSNITVTITGDNTYTNLPLDVVRLDSATGRILDAYISSNIARLMSDGTINPAMLPVQQAPRSTFMRTTDRVGIGIKNAAQRLHVNNGNQCITGGRLGIGTSTTPLGALHVWDQNSGVPSVRIDNSGSYDTLNIIGSNNAPLLYITGSCNVGIWTAAPQYPLDVNGTIHTTSIKTNSIDSDSGTIDCKVNNFNNILTATMANLVVTNSITLPTIVMTSETTANNIYTNVLGASTNTNIQVTSAMNITGVDTSLYTGNASYSSCNQIGLRVNNNIMTQSVLTISDRRVKTNISDTDPSAHLDTVLAIPVHNFTFLDRPGQKPTVGFIAQEVEEIAPYAVDTTTNALPSIMRVATYSDKILSIDTSNLTVTSGDTLRILHKDIEYTRTVNECDYMAHVITLTEPIPIDTGDVFVYGQVVNDFKLINNDRMMPLAFNAIKSLYSMYEKQQALLETILQKINGN